MAKKYPRGLNLCCLIGKSDENEHPIPEQIDHPFRAKVSTSFRDVFRCSGESDALNLASLGFHVYWLNSESATLDYDDYKRIDTLLKTITRSWIWMQPDVIML